MKKIWKVFGAVLAALFLRGMAQADSGKIVIDKGDLVPIPAAYSSTFSFRTDGMNWGSAQVVVTSATQSAVTFNDGRASTATFTVVSYTALSTATATGKITVANLGFLGSKTTPQCVSGGGPGIGQFGPVCAGTDWLVTASTGATACALSAAINAYNVVVTTCTGAASTGIVYTTATYAGTAWNNFVINTSSNTANGALAVVQMTGGQDNATLTINGTTLQANKDFYPLTSTTATAAAIAAAIAKNYAVIGATATSASNVIYATSTVVGASTKYATASSTQSALTISPYTSSGTFGGVGTMYGGFDSSFTINTSQIKLANSGLGLAEDVIFGGTLSPFVNGTTYYAIPNTANGTIQLSLTSTGAVAGLPVVILASATKTTTDTYTLTPGVLTGTPSIQWVVSNDNTNWQPFTPTAFNITIPSVSYGTYVATGTVTNFDFGRMDYGYLGLNVTAPTAGAVNIKARIIGKE